MQPGLSEKICNRQGCCYCGHLIRIMQHDTLPWGLEFCLFCHVIVTAPYSAGRCGVQEINVAFACGVSADVVHKLM